MQRWGRRGSEAGLNVDVVIRIAPGPRELTRLAPIFKCPACSRAGAAHLDGNSALVCECGKSYELCGKSVQTVASLPMSDAWKQKQVEGEGRYRAAGYHANDTVDRLFGGFIAVNAKRDDVLLDVGCGIRPEPPPYVSELGLELPRAWSRSRRRCRARTRASPARWWRTSRSPTPR